MPKKSGCYIIMSKNKTSFWFKFYNFWFKFNRFIRLLCVLLQRYFDEIIFYYKLKTKRYEKVFTDFRRSDTLS